MADKMRMHFGRSGRFAEPSNTTECCESLNANAFWTHAGRSRRDKKRKLRSNAQPGAPDDFNRQNGIQVYGEMAEWLKARPC